jgi:hypothetical protein
LLVKHYKVITVVVAEVEVLVAAFLHMELQMLQEI